MLRDFDGLLPLVVGVVGYVLNEGVNEGVLKSNKISFHDILSLMNNQGHLDSS